MSIYLDYNATAPMRPEAKAAVVAAMDVGGNASSVHAAGRRARDVAERGRAAVAALLGVKPEQVIFTSGGTEANAQAIADAVHSGSRRLIVSAAEHPCITKAADASGAVVETWPVNRDGVVELGWLEERLSRWDVADGRPWVSLVAAQNETGVIQPVAEAAAVVRAAGGRLHTDAIQAAGKVPLDFAALGADTVALSGHKLGGPMGVGALVYAAGSPPAPLMLGGEQEFGRRAGTLNIQGVAGFGAAAEASLADLAHAAEHAGWRDMAARRLKDSGGVTIFGEQVTRLPNTLALAADGYANDRQLMALDLAGVMVSAGSACSSGKMKPSRIVAAMGFEDLAGCMLRVSGGWATTEADWDRFTTVWLEAWERHRARRAA